MIIAAGQTIQQIRETEPEHLWHFLTQLPSSFEAELLYGLLLFGTLGMLASWFGKWVQGDTGGLWQYVITGNLKPTLASVFSFLGVALAAIASDIFTTDSGEFVGWLNLAVFAFSNGAGIDAVVNKGKKPIWTKEQRKAKAK